MKIDLAGFVPNRSLTSGLASNIDVDHVLEKASKGYIEQIQEGAAVVEGNLHKVYALYSLRKMMSNLYIGAESEVIDSLWHRRVNIDNEDYIMASISPDAEVIDLTISEVKLAQPQYITVKSFANTDESVTNKDGFSTGSMNIHHKSYIKKIGDAISLVDGQQIIEAKLSADFIDSRLPIEPFSLIATNSISVNISGEKFLAENLPTDIAENLTFISAKNHTLELTIGSAFSLSNATNVLNDVFGIDTGVNVKIEPGDSLQVILDKFNTAGKKINVSAYILRAADNQFNLIIKSDRMGLANEFVIQNSVLPDHVVTPAQDSSLMVDNHTINASSNEVEILVGSLLIYIMKDSPVGQKIKLKIEPDIELMRRSVERFVQNYNDVLQFINEQTERDVHGNFKETATLGNSTAIDLIKSKLSYVLSKEVSGVTLVDFGIFFDSDSNLYIDDSRLIRALKSDDNRDKLKIIIENISKAVRNTLNYDGEISKEIDHIVRINEVQANKIDNVKKNLRSTQESLYKQFSNLEAKALHANYAMKMLEDQMRSYYGK